jgi:hypothetical protein
MGATVRSRPNLRHRRSVPCSRASPWVPNQRENGSGGGWNWVAVLMKRGKKLQSDGFLSEAICLPTMHGTTNGGGTGTALKIGPGE